MGKHNWEILFDDHFGCAVVAGHFAVTNAAWPVVMGSNLRRIGSIIIPLAV